MRAFMLHPVHLLASNMRVTSVVSRSFRHHNLSDRCLQEGHSCERFAALYSHVPRVRTPAILWEATARRVLTMEWSDGVKLTDKAKMAAAGLDIIDFVNVL